MSQPGAPRTTSIIKIMSMFSSGYKNNMFKFKTDIETKIDKVRKEVAINDYRY